MSEKIYWCEVLGSPEFKFSYRLPSGRLALGADEKGTKVLRLLLENSEGWDYENSKIAVLNQSNSEDDLYKYFHLIRNRNGTGTFVTFHERKIDDEVTDVLSHSLDLTNIQRIEPDQKEKRLSNVFEKFGMMCLWSLELSPTIFSDERNRVEALIDKISSSVDIDVEEVFDQEMPVW